jgi:hypothetical protein
VGRIYEVWKEEVERKNEDDGKIIIPEVIIRGKTLKKLVKNVEVTSHDMRHDQFQPGTVTALDVIMSLGDQDIIEYDLKWYESISVSAKVVKNYWIEGIGRDNAFGRCGFVYEAGSHRFDGFRGNHIHLPTDSRVLNSPEYVEFFWICL